MDFLRNILAVTAGGAFGLLVAELILLTSPRDTGLLIAVMAACVIARYGIKAVQEDRDDQRHLERERTWMRRQQDPRWMVTGHSFHLPTEQENKR